MCRTSLSGLFQVDPRVAQRWLLGGQAARTDGRSLTRSNGAVQAIFQGQAAGRCRVMRRADEASLAGTVISLRRRVAVVALARSGAASVPAVRVRLNAMTRQYQPGGVGVEHPRRQVRPSRVFEIGVDRSMT
jgi:hypothetical protein